MASSACAQELCPNWSGDGDVCPCAVFALDKLAVETRMSDRRPASMLTDVHFDYDLTDLVGLDPDFTGGLDATEYVARQNCDHDETRAKTVEQFTAALLTGLDDLPRDQHRRIAPGDVEQLVARVALEVGR